MRLGPKSLSISSSKLFWTAVFLLAGAAAFPLLSGAGLLNTRGGGDSPFLLQRVHQVVVALRDGHFPVRWMPDANYGYGYPFFNFYAPLSTYIAAMLHFLGLSYVGAIKAAQLLGFLVAGGGMFYLGRTWFKSSWAGLLAAAAYTFAPFHMVNIYVRGDSLAEFWAMAFFPIVMITAHRLIQHPKRPERIALFALAYAALILTHNISALIFTPFLLFYFALALILIFRHQKSLTNQPITNYQIPITLRTFLILSSLLLALLLAAWFWLPALAEQNLVQLEPVTAGYFHYSNHFRGTDLIQNTLLFDYDVSGGRAFRMGLVQLVIIIAGTAALLLTGLRNRGAIFNRSLVIIFSLLIATFMISPLSRPLWDNLPLLPFTQFPWRFLSVQAFFGALAVGGLALLPGRNLLLPIVILSIAISGLGNLQTDHIYLTDEDIIARKLAEYEWFTGNIGSTVSAEYLPTYVQPRPWTGPWLTVANRPSFWQFDRDVQVEAISQETDEQIWQIASTKPAAITLPLMDWTGWQVSVDGVSLNNYPAPGTGLLTFALPSGNHTVYLRLSRTPIQLTAEILSTVALLVTGLLLWPAARRNANRQLPWIVAGIAALAIFTFIIRLLPVAVPSDNTLSWDFEQLGYLHHAPDGISFENGLLLRQYTYNESRVRPGEDLIITLNWENGNGTTAEIALTTPTIQRYENAPILISQTQTVKSGEVVYRLTIPENAPTSLYIPRLTVANARSLTDSGHLRGDLFLQPVQILNLARRAEGENAPLNVQAVNVGYQSPNVLLVHLEWLTLEPLPKNYNVSLRLVDNNGLLLAQQDVQPAYGNLPSSGWLPGRWEDDWLTLPLPDNISAEQQDDHPYALMAHLYDVETGEVLLIRRLGEMVLQEDKLIFQEAKPTLSLPENITPAVATFEEIIRLEGYTLEQSAESLNLTLFWLAMADGQEDYFHFIHLVDPETGNIIAQHDSMPRNNTYPTAQWRQNEIIIDPVQLSLEDVPPGEYQLYVGLYQNLDDTSPPLTAIDNAGQPLDGNRLFLQNVVIK